MPNMGLWMVAYKWMFGGTLANAKQQYGEYIRNGKKQAMFAIIDCYKQNAAYAWAND